MFMYLEELMAGFAHLDADAFFASVEQAADTRLRGIPMAVGGGRRGVITSASYEARAQGIYTAMPTRRALQMCPGLVIVPGQFELYEEFSENLFGLCRNLTPWVEKTSIDEAYLDFNGCRGGKAMMRALRKLDREICGWLKITVSQGLAGNKLVAAVASKLRKPHGFVVVPPGAEAAFLAPLSLRRLPGLGPVAAAALAGVGARVIADLTRLGPAGLRPFLGGRTDHFLEAARGIDNRPLVMERRSAKSYSQQHTFEQDQGDETFIEGRLKAMIDALLAKIRVDHKQVRTLTIRLRYTDMEGESVSRSLADPSDLESDFYPLVRPLLRTAWTRRVHLRLAGVKFSNIYEVREQADLFDTHRARRRLLAKAIDRLNRDYGEHTLIRAGHIRKAEG